VLETAMIEIPGHTARSVTGGNPDSPLLVLCFAIWIGVSGCVSPEADAPADLILRGGRVVTVDDARPEAEAIAIRGYEIAAVGSNREIDALRGPETEVIELDGRLAIPGFIEGHGHFMSLGRAKLILDLTRARSWNEIVEQVAEAARGAERGAWIFGSGWHQEKWLELPEPDVDGVPLHHGLSAVSPDNPVSLAHASRHAIFVNAAALEAAGIDADTPDPPGGTIARDSDGNPTGLLREAAQGLIGASVAAESDERSPRERETEARRLMELAGWEALSKGITTFQDAGPLPKGITTFQDAGASFEEIDRYKVWAAEGALPVRLYAMVGLEVSNETLAARLADYRIIPTGNDFLAVRSIKRMIDGGLGSHGAWLLEPYSDMSSSTGLVLDSIGNIEETGRIAIRHGFQLNTHAIGDRANREILGIYQRIFEQNPNLGDLRWRVEHAQHVDPADVPRFAELGVIASMQGVHATSDGPWLPERLGELRAGRISYVWRSLLDAGTVVINGTDVPVEDVDPIASFHASVTRQMASGELFHPEQSMTRTEALRSYTIDSAYAAFEEHRMGSITPGKLADITVLSEDILTVPVDEIRNAQVVYTIVGGKVAFSGESP
jgi:predicted amidohydrolase YtcJ